MSDKLLVCRQRAVPLNAVGRQSVPSAVADGCEAKPSKELTCAITTRPTSAVDSNSIAELDRVPIRYRGRY